VLNVEKCYRVQNHSDKPRWTNFYCAVIHPYTGTVGGDGGVGWTFSDTAHVDSEAWYNSDIANSAPNVQNLNVELDDVTTWDCLEEKMLQTLLVTFYVLL